MKRRQTGVRVVSMLLLVAMLFSLVSVGVEVVEAGNESSDGKTVNLDVKVNAEDYILQTVTATTIPLVQEPFNNMIVQSGTSGFWHAELTRTNHFRNFLGIVLAAHYGTTAWTYGNGFLVDQPRNIYNDWWTFPPHFMSAESASWDWFHPGENGTGQSNLRVTFVFGIPTPWGPAGSNYTSRIITTVFSDGSFQ